MHNYFISFFFLFKCMPCHHHYYYSSIHHKVCGWYPVPMFVSFNVDRLGLYVETRVRLANLQWCINDNHQNKRITRRTSLSVVMVIGSPCLLIPLNLTHWSFQFVFIVDGGVVNKKETKTKSVVFLNICLRNVCALIPPPPNHTQTGQIYQEKWPNNTRPRTILYGPIQKEGNDVVYKGPCTNDRNKTNRDFDMEVWGWAWIMEASFDLERGRNVRVN